MEKQAEQTSEVKEEVVDKKLLMKKSIKKACGKQRFAGFLYFLGTILFSIASFFSLLKGVAYTENREINVLNFWTPIEEVFHLKFSFLPIGMNFFVSILYLFTIIFCFVNAMRAIGALDALYMKGNKKIGFNQNAIAMDKLGRIFSSTFVCLMYWMYFTHMFLGARPTALFYIVVVLFLIIHFWAGIVGAGASRFTARDGIQEFPRTKGRVAPVIRNVMQMLLVGGMMMFMSRANIINNFLLFFFNGTPWVTVFGSFKANFGTFVYYFLNPLLQLAICHFMLVIVSHACGTSEWHRDGSKAKGRKTCRIFSILIAAFAVLFNIAHLYLNVGHDESNLSLMMIFVAVLAIALFVMECCMAHLPGDKKKVEAAERVEDLEDKKEEPAEEAQTVCTTCQYKFIDVPMIFMQPNGQPIMVMPMLPIEEETEEEKPEEQGEPKKIAKPLGGNELAKEQYKKAVKDKWLQRANGNPEEQADQPQEEKEWKKPSEEEDNLVLGEEKKVKCPHCGSIVWAQEGAPAYLCPDCNEKFSF